MSRKEILDYLITPQHSPFMAPLSLLENGKGEIQVLTKEHEDSPSYLMTLKKNLRGRYQVSIEIVPNEDASRVLLVLLPL